MCKRVTVFFIQGWCHHPTQNAYSDLRSDTCLLRRGLNEAFQCRWCLCVKPCSIKATDWCTYRCHTQAFVVRPEHCNLTFGFSSRHVLSKHAANNSMYITLFYCILHLYMHTSKTYIKNWVRNAQIKSRWPYKNAMPCERSTRSRAIMKQKQQAIVLCVFVCVCVCLLWFLLHTGNICKSYAGTDMLEKVDYTIDMWIPRIHLYEYNCYNMLTHYTRYT